jgi:precorrin-2 dehydrogenase / sirohydrochlorin ferrochelatase
VLPISLNPEMVRIGLAGAGEGFERRQAALTAAGVDPLRVSCDSSDAALQSLSVLFVAGLEDDAAKKLAGRARALGVLVNVEDKPELCDFHLPAMARRGALLLTVSTGGRAPGLARRLREWLEERFGPEWDERLKTLGNARAAWRADGARPGEVSRRMRDLVEKKGWLS